MDPLANTARNMQASSISTGSTFPVSWCMPLLDEGLRLGHDRLDGPVEPLGRVDRMGQQVAGHTRAGGFDVQSPQRGAPCGTSAEMVQSCR